MDGHIDPKASLSFEELQQRNEHVTTEAAAPKDLILCVDDESAIRRASSIAIVEGGFGVEVADSGEAGLRAFLRHRNEICLVVSDIVMPGTINGFEMVDKILKIDPTMKVLMMTGYSDRMVNLQGGNRFPLIRKPFLQSDLLKKVRSVLGPDAVFRETNGTTVGPSGVVRESLHGIVNWLKSGAQTELEWTINTDKLTLCLLEMRRAPRVLPAVPLAVHQVDAMLMAMWSRNRRLAFDLGVSALAVL